jgi:antitoxin ParD1/3/4
VGLRVVLSQEVTQFIERKLEQGEYGSADELIENAVRMLKLGDRDEPIGQTDEEKLQWLRAAYLAGLASGDAGPLDAESLKAEARRRRAAKR